MYLLILNIRESEPLFIDFHIEINTFLGGYHNEIPFKFEVDKTTPYFKQYLIWNLKILNKVLYLCLLLGISLEKTGSS